jgi:phage terminase small subunit
MLTRPQSERPLSPKERIFVDRYLALSGKRGAGKQAAEAAGYPASWSAIAAHRLLRRPRVMRAIEEESKRLVRALGPQAIKVIKEILDDREHKDRLKAARTVLERIDPAFVGFQHQHHVEVVESGVETALKILRIMRELQVPIEVQRERLGPNLFPQLEAMLDGEALNGNGNGKASESEPLMIEGRVVAAEHDEVGGDDDAA